jgi:hypothetical protein
MKYKLVVQVRISSEKDSIKYFFLLVTYDISAENIHSAVSTTDFHDFCIQIRLLHSDGFPSELSKEYYDCETWSSKEFTEGKSNILP